MFKFLLIYNNIKPYKGIYILFKECEDETHVKLLWMPFKNSGTITCVLVLSPDLYTGINICNSNIQTDDNSHILSLY